MNHIGGDFGELDGAVVDRLNEQLSELGLSLQRSLERLGELFLEVEHDIFHVATADQLEGNVEGFALDFHVGRAKDAKDVHDEVIEHTSVVLGAEVLDAVKNDELDVVVRLLDDEVDVGRSGSCCTNTRSVHGPLFFN